MALVGKEAAKREFMKFLGRKKFRLTSQRLALIDTVFNTTQHFTAEQLLEWGRRVDESISRATVYRTLLLLTESGLIKEVDFGKDHKFSDPNYAAHPTHCHIICQDCGKIVEFDSDKLAELEKDVSERLGFTVLSRRLEITASCNEFRTHGFCNKKSH